MVGNEYIYAIGSNACLCSKSNTTTTSFTEESTDWKKGTASFVGSHRTTNQTQKQ